MTIPGLTAGTRIWGRGARVLLNGVMIAQHLPQQDGHRIEFRVVRHNRIEPNECEVRIYGLADEVRASITAGWEAARALILAAGGNGTVGDLILQVGYDGVLEQMCKCDIVEILHEPITPGWVTTIRAKDGVLPFANSLVSESIAPGVDANLVMKTLAASMKIAFLDADSEAEFQSQLSQFSGRMLDGGFVMEGPTRDVLTSFLDSLKLAWSFQDGKLQLLRFDGTTLDQAILLSPTTGLQRVRTRDLGAVTAWARINPRATPGRQVSLVDELGKPYGAGIFRIDKAEASGDTDEGPWDHQLELRPSVIA